MKKIKAILKLIKDAFVIRYHLIRLFFHHVKENKRNAAEAREELFTRNKFIKIWHDKPNVGTNGKRLELFNEQMNYWETETFNTLFGFDDKRIEREYKKAFKK
jgi:hypothetical protein